jgi:hypothetical protein
MWRQGEARIATKSGRLLELTGGELKAGGSFKMPLLPALEAGGGLTIETWLKMRELSPGQVLFDGRDKSGKGIALTFSDRFTLRLTLSDGQRTSSWESDPGTHPGSLKVNQWQHIVVSVDGGPKIVTFVVDGVLNDGGAVRQYGWGRFDPLLTNVNGLDLVRLAPALYGQIGGLNFYDRALKTSEAVGNFRAGR